IIISSVIGTGVFSGNGEALSTAGPLGLIITVMVLGLIAVCVGETVSELVQVWAVPNAVYEYIYAFVDKDLAAVIALLYWYSFSSAFAVQMLGAANLLTYWLPDNTWPPFVFYGVVPWVLVAVNMLGVRIYGWIETVFGFLKVVLLFSVTCLLYYISNKAITDGLQYNPNTTLSKAHAFFQAIPSVAYSYIGIETAVIAAFEAKTSRSMAVPSRISHWYIFLSYFLCTLGIALTVRWDNPHLRRALGDLQEPRSNSAVIIAIFADGQASLAGFVNGCLIMSLVSAANTSLYISSRTLYGLVVTLNGSNFVSRWLKGFGLIWRTTGVPTRSLFFTMVAFYWLPWLNQLQSITVDSVLKTLSLTASMATILVWAGLCLAFHRYELWSVSTYNDLRKFVRGTLAYENCEDRMVWNVGMSFQPWLARLGFLGCILVLVSASATWWSVQATVLNVASAYAPVSLHGFGYVRMVLTRTAIAHRSL
ncbi:hypothetical protein GQ53DRAFT_866849, partial [Thozetella sp. PMI_491]